MECSRPVSLDTVGLPGQDHRSAGPTRPLEEALHGHRPKKGMLVGKYATLSPKRWGLHSQNETEHDTSNRLPHSAEVHLCALWLEEKVLGRGKAERGSRIEVPTSHHKFPVSDLGGHCKL